MDKRKALLDVEVLDADILELLAETEEPIEIPEALAARMRGNVIDRIKQEQEKVQQEVAKQTGFSIVRTNDSEWVEAMPGAYYKILHDDGNGFDGLLSYLFKLDAGFTMHGHGHPFDEETLMLEGDLTMGNITLHKGDFHFAAAGVTHDSVSTKHGCIAFLRGAFPV